ncbi:MAG: sigma-70 family RNA polymerase sigma factor [Prolixibacteraceae bacterium]
MALEDQTIWNSFVAGEVNALRVLHDKYFHPMCIWANKHLRDEIVAEEIVSDCFIKLWERRGKISIKKSLKSYLFLMLRNQLVSHLRKDKNKLIIETDKIPEIMEEMAIEQDFYSNLYTAINKIPERRRRILELAVFESLTYKEIAERLDISLNTVKTQIGRAYQALKEELDPNDFVLLSVLLKKN